MSPLPTEELVALERSIAEVGAVGRNLNQITRAMSRGERRDDIEVAYLQGLMKVLAGLRAHTKALITAILGCVEFAVDAIGEKDFTFAANTADVWQHSSEAKNT